MSHLAIVKEKIFVLENLLRDNRAQLIIFAVSSDNVRMEKTVLIPAQIGRIRSITATHMADTILLLSEDAKLYSYNDISAFNLGSTVQLVEANFFRISRAGRVKAISVYDIYLALLYHDGQIEINNNFFALFGAIGNAKKIDGGCMLPPVPCNSRRSIEDIVISRESLRVRTHRDDEADKIYDLVPQRAADRFTKHELVPELIYRKRKSESWVSWKFTDHLERGVAAWYRVAAGNELLLNTNDGHYYSASKASKLGNLNEFYPPNKEKSFCGNDNYLFYINVVGKLVAFFSARCEDGSSAPQVNIWDEAIRRIATLDCVPKHYLFSQHCYIDSQIQQMEIVDHLLCILFTKRGSNDQDWYLHIYNARSSKRFQPFEFDLKLTSILLPLDAAKNTTRRVTFVDSNSINIVCHKCHQPYTVQLPAQGNNAIFCGDCLRLDLPKKSILLVPPALSALPSILLPPNTPASKNFSSKDGIAEDHTISPINERPKESTPRSLEELIAYAKEYRMRHDPKS